MALRETELDELVPELATLLVGRRLSNSWQPARDHVVLGFEDGTSLLLVPRGPDARLNTIRRRPQNPSRPFSFQGALRAHLHGALLGIERVGVDRIVELIFETARLHLRLTGKSGGLWLLRDGAVAAAYDGPAAPTLPDVPSMPPRSDPPRFRPAAGQTWDDAAGRFYALRIRQRRETELRSGLARSLRREESRLLRLQGNLEGDLEKAEKADSIREQADTLAAHLHEVVPGPDHVDLPSYDDASRMLRIPLLPGKPAARAMERLYTSARRLDRMGEQVLGRLDRAQSDLADVRAQLAEVDALGLDALEALQKTVVAADQVTHKRIPGVVTWTGPQGERVLVGKDVKANRRVTFQIGRGDDYWMHLRGRPGAHLLLPMKKGQSPTLELLLAAAQIAAVHGSVQHGDRAEVQYTRIRHVRSLPGTGHASVMVHDEKVLQIVRDPATLAGWSRD